MDSTFTAKVVDTIRLLDTLHLKDSVFSNGIEKNFWEIWGSALIGFIGVLVGALITYFSTKRLTKQQTMGRFAVQKKNLILSPIYKELLKVKEYLESKKDTIDIDFNTNNLSKQRLLREQGVFWVWNDMKLDIRKVYVPLSIQKHLESINENITQYKNEKNKVIERYAKLYSDSNLDALYNEIYNEEMILKQKITFGLGLPNFIFMKDDLFEKYFSDICESKGLNDSRFEGFKLKLYDFLKNIKVHLNLRMLNDRYENLIKTINITMEELNEKIDKIIKTFEYGQEIEEL